MVAEEEGDACVYVLSYGDHVSTVRGDVLVVR